MSAKRILSGLLALVLLLGNVPVTALATDTLPEETLTVVTEEVTETTALITEPVTEAPTEAPEPTEVVTEAPTEAPETTAPIVVETTVATEPVVVETTAETEPVVTETTVETEPVVIETTVETEPVVIETTVETEPVVIETTEETEPVVIETIAPTEPVTEETVPEETVEPTEEVEEEITEEAVNSVSGTCGTNVTWTYDEDTFTLTISGEGAMNSYSSSNRPWEDYEDSILAVVIEEGVTSIGNYAFYHFDALTTVTVPVSVTSISYYSFRNCNALTDIYYGGNYSQWEAISGYSYAHASGRTIHKTPAGTLGDSHSWAFDTATGTLTISGEGEMPDISYYGSSSTGYDHPWVDFVDSITAVVLEDGITAIGNYAFFNHTALKSVTFADTVTEIGSFAFAHCDSLTEITIPGNITSLYNSAFAHCDVLTTVTLEEGVAYIGRQVFGECAALTTITIPVSVTTIEYDVISFCTVLTDIYYAGDYSQWENINGHYYVEQSGVTIHKTPKGTCGDEATWTFDEETGTLTISGKGETYGWGSNSNSPTKYNHPWKDFAGSITKVVVEEGITALGQYAFNNHTALKSVTLPKSLTTLYSCAFSWCEKLTKIVIPEGVTTIYSYAFSNCTALKSVTIPATVTELYYNAFDGCTALTDIYYGSTKSAWDNLGCADYEPCKSATIHTTPAGICGENLTWNFNASTGVLTIQGKGAMNDYNYSRAPWFDYVEKIKSVTVKSGVTTIGNDAFGKYSYDDPTYTRLTKVTLPSTITSIGTDAFGSCTALTSITIPAKVTSIGNYAFRGCTSLATVTLQKGLKTIGSYAFQDCTKLRSITIPSSVTEIGDRAFYGCTKLDTVTLYKGLKTIGAYAFSGCARLAAITIPASVTSIGEGAFNGCKAITKVTIPAGITTIEPYTFQNCGITQITIPESVTTIGYRAFADTALTSVTVPATVTNLGEYVFSGCDYMTTATLPKGMTVIPKGTFSSCDKLTKVTIPSTVTEIGAYAFSSCSSLTSITLPTKLTTINESAFSSCWRLAQIVIPKNVDLIDYKAFAYCDNLKLIHFKGNAPDMYPDTFQNVTADAIYPRKNSTWNSGARQNYGGTITWTTCYPLTVTPRVSDGKPKLTWGKVTGASKYKVYRSTRANGGFSLLKTTTSTSFVNTGATYGKTYYYKVTTIFTDGTQATSRIVSCNSVLPAPSITVTKNSNGNPVIKWKAVSGAHYYEIRRLTEDGYHSMGTGTDKLSYVDKDAEAGVTYQYQVLAIGDNWDYRSQYCDPVTFTVPLEKPAITLSNVASSGKIKISWSAVPHAEKYQVYRATSKDGTYKRIATTTATSLTNTSAEVGKTYYYKVKAIHADTSANSPFSAIKSRMCDLPAPVITVELNASGKPRTSWAKVDGAVKYQVWRATSKNGKYTRLTTTTNLYQVNKNAVAGKTYYYKVRAVYSNTNANSAFSSIKSIKAK